MDEDDPDTQEALAHLEAFKARLLARNPNAPVLRVKAKRVPLLFLFLGVFFLRAQYTERENAGSGRVFFVLPLACRRESVEEREGVQKREKIFFNFSHSPRATRPLCEIEAAFGNS